MPDEPLRVVSLGDLVADLVAAIPRLPVEARGHQLASSLALEAGGAGNFLIAGARLGMEMHALGALGDDLFGQAVRDALGREGIRLEGVVSLPGTTTTTVIALLDEQGEHVYLGKYGQGADLVMPDVWKGLLSGSQAVHSYGYTLQEARMAQSCQDALAYAAGQDVPVFFDIGPEMARTTPEQRAFIRATARVLLMTEEEIPLITSGQTGLDGARQLLDERPELVCVKRGERGCVLFSRGQTVEHPGFPVQARDTSAAGDSFAAAFIYAWLQRWPLEEIAAFANAMGAAKVRKAGSGSQVPTAREVQDVLDEFRVPIQIAIS